jgi:hypothetical protein
MVYFELVGYEFKAAAKEGKAAKKAGSKKEPEVRVEEKKLASKK